MIKKIRRRKQSNQGNSFIVVVATISFLAVMTTALLVAVALCFRLKAYDINSRDNFYYLEQAMDEIYEGVGGIAMKQLNSAFEETAQAAVYYDIDQKAYVTMSNDDANKLLQAAFCKKVWTNGNISTITEAENTLTDFSPTIKDASNNIELSIGNVIKDDKLNTVVVKNLVLKRTQKYSTVNAYKDGSGAGAADYVQSITTDLVISPPDFYIDFDSIESDEIYDFTMIGGLGIEVTGIGTKANITGNVYAASDYYNIEYINGKHDDGTSTNTTKYANLDAGGLEKYNGVDQKSMYSGFYVDAANVSIVADRLIVPGSIAAMNNAQLSVVGSRKDTDSEYSQVWTDNVVLGGYSIQVGDNMSGSVVKMKADAYVSDDLEINAAGSDFELYGTYYGYSDATKDNRTFSSAYINKVTGLALKRDNYEKDATTGTYTSGGDTITLPGQAHYNSSSIVVNGSESKLDLSKVSSLYIAGQAYVEMSKSTVSTTYDVSYDGQTFSTTVDSYAYENEDDEKYYTQKDGTKSRVEDYQTRESLSIKSNQLAYIPPYTVDENEETGEVTVRLDPLLKENEYFNDLWENLEKVPVIKTVVDGKKYYFYDFSKVKKDVNGNPVVDVDKYLAMYAELFTLNAGDIRSAGEMMDYYDITDYEPFKVKSIAINEESNYGNIFSNSTISLTSGTDNVKVSVVEAQNDNISPLLAVRNKLGLSGASDTAGDGTTTGETASVAASQVTRDLYDRYQLMKVLLTDTPVDGDDKDAASAINEDSITPIDTYFNFNALDVNSYTESASLSSDGSLVPLTDPDAREKSGYLVLKSGYKVFLNDGDVTVRGADSNGIVRGIVLCKGDVTFDPSVTHFEGLIVAGGKITISSSVDCITNREVIKSILYEADESQYLDGAADISYIAKMFKKYNLMDKTVDDSVESMKSVLSVQYADLLSYDNWMKNVD